MGMTGPHRIRVMYPAEQVAARVRELGAEITRDYEGLDLTIVSVLKGSFLFMADLCRQIDLHIACEFLGLQSYGDATTTSGVVRITSDLTRPIAGKDVLIVEDIVDTGLTMAYLQEFLKTRHPRSVKLCALLHKPDRAVKPVTIDYLGFTIPNKFVVGFGLDLEQKCRNLPYIGEVEGVVEA
jgi:hypoxanthine phosphoribosyltransferase